jgi:hypothetical protein
MTFVESSRVVYPKTTVLLEGARLRAAVALAPAPKCLAVRAAPSRSAPAARDGDQHGPLVKPRDAD